jgi:hypothetical protein
MHFETDPVVDYVHNVRREIAVAFDHDVRKFMIELRRLEQEHFEARLIKDPFRPEPEKAERPAPEA